MRIRLSVFLFSALVLIAIGLMFWFSKRATTATRLQEAMETNAAQSETSASRPPIPALVPSKTSPTTEGGREQPKATTQSQGGKADRMLEILSTYNDVPIDFYGKLVDQFGSPVAGAEIKGRIRIINGYTQSTDSLSVTSGADGRFEFHGKGQDIGIAPTKPGYAYVSMNGTGTYSLLTTEAERAHPDPRNPVVLQMWKLQGGERLVHFQTQASVPIDGRPRAFDLETGALVQSGGDIVISVETSPQPDVRQQYDWKITIQAIGGGLLISTKSFDLMFQAPDSGYESKFVMAYQKGSEAWSTTFNGVFYLSSRSGGCYGKVAIEVLSDVVKNGSVPLILNSYLNAAGSRNLEIEPRFVAEAHP